jgi:hypothetical protein
VAIERKLPMDSENFENRIVSSIEIAWIDDPIPELETYSYNIDWKMRQINIKIVINNKITENQMEELSIVDLEVCTQLPDNWSVSSIFIEYKSIQNLDESDRVVFRRGDALTPKERYRIRRAALRT